MVLRGYLLTWQGQRIMTGFLVNGQQLRLSRRRYCGTIHAHLASYSDAPMYAGIYRTPS